MFVGLFQDSNAYPHPPAISQHYWGGWNSELILLVSTHAFSVICGMHLIVPASESLH